MSDNLLDFAIVVLIVAALYEVFVATHRAAARVDQESGDLLLDIPFAFKASSLLVLLTGSIIAYFNLFGVGPKLVGTRIFGLLFLIFIVWPKLFTIVILNDTYTLDGAGIRWRRAWRHDVSFTWDEVTSLHYSRLLDMFAIRSDSKIMWLPVHLNGIKVFAETVSKRMPAAKWIKAKRKVDELLVVNEDT